MQHVSKVLLGLLALCLLAFTGCQTTQLGDTINASPLLARSLDLGEQLATYKALQQNPEYIDLAFAIADYLEDAEQGADLLAAIKGELVPRYVSTIEGQLLATGLIDGFADVLRANVSEENRYARLPQIAANIRTGASLAVP